VNEALLTSTAETPDVSRGGSSGSDCNYCFWYSCKKLYDLAPCGFHYGHLMAPVYTHEDHGVPLTLLTFQSTFYTNRFSRHI